MQAGNTHQMCRSGAIEGRPEVAMNRLLITDHQRHQDASPRVALGRQHSSERGAHLMTQTLDDIGWTPDHPVHPLRRILAHVAGGPDVAFEQPGFVIEAVGIGVAVRPLEAHRQLPALAGAQWRTLENFAVAPPLVPRQHDSSGNDCCCTPRVLPVWCGQPLFHIEFEAAALAEILRQTRDDADDLDIAPFPFTWQLLGQPQLGTPAGPGETEGETGHQRQPASHQCATPTQRRQHQQQARQRPGPDWWQFRLHMHGDDAGGEGENVEAHPAIIEATSCAST